MSESPPPISRQKTTIWVILLVVAGIFLTVLFGIRTIRSYTQFHRQRMHPIATDVELIRGWMSIHYISRAYRVPEDYLFSELGIPKIGNLRKSLNQLNTEYGGGQPDFILDRVKTIIRQFQTQHPTPPVPNPTPSAGSIPIHPQL